MLPSAQSDKHLTATRTHRFTVSLPLANAFTLFEPVGEKLWAAGWNPVFATPGDAELNDGTVFTWNQAHHGQNRQSIWLITRYDRHAGIIEYRTILPDIRVNRIFIQCRSVRESETSVEVTYAYTGLSEAGDHSIAAMTEEKFRQFIDEWAGAIRNYLARGTPATP